MKEKCLTFSLDLLPPSLPSPLSPSFFSPPSPTAISPSSPSSAIGWVERGPAMAASDCLSFSRDWSTYGEKKISANLFGDGCPRVTCWWNWVWSNAITSARERDIEELRGESGERQRERETERQRERERLTLWVVLGQILGQTEYSSVVHSLHWETADRNPHSLLPPLYPHSFLSLPPTLSLNCTIIIYTRIGSLTSTQWHVLETWRRMDDYLEKRDWLPDSPLQSLPQLHYISLSIHSHREMDVSPSTTSMTARPMREGMVSFAATWTAIAPPILQCVCVLCWKESWGVLWVWG